ncbi:MAG: potassium channel family protein [Solirubrobacterales bacterium]|nr:potassium channel family protein [Solirubrobacterales bacterium]
MKLPFVSREFGAERYGMPMILLLLSMVVIMATRSGGTAAAVALTLQGLALLATFRAAEVWSLARLFVSILIVIAIVLGWTRAFFDERIDPAVVPVATVILVLVATPVIVFGIVRQARRDGSITVHTLFGTVCIYLLVSLGFASAFAVIGLKSGTHFFAQGPEWDSLRDCLYFSLTTITTAGLGDLSPATNLGRALTASEALFGQIYIVTVVALVVGRVGRRPVRDDPDE